MKSDQYILILIFTTIVILAWIGFGFYHTISSSTLEPDIATKMQRIAPSFSTQTINALLNRRQVPPTYEIGNRQSSSSAEIEPPTTTPIPTEFPAPTLFEEEIASEGGESL